MATRIGRVCAGGRKGAGFIAPFLSTLVDNIRITGADTETAPPSYIARTLVDRGAIAFVRATRTWAAFTVEGRKRRTGLPRLVKLKGEDGLYSEPMGAGEGKDAEICIIPANAYMLPPCLAIEKKAQTLDAVASALRQNLDALRQSTVIVYSDANLKSQIEAAEKARLDGKNTVSICTNMAGSDVKIENFSPEAQNYLADILAVWTNTVEELDELTGRAKIGDKMERRTDDEIGVIVQSSSSNVNTINHTFNAFCEWYGIDAHAESPFDAYAGKEGQDGETDDKNDGEPQNGDERA